MLIVVKSVKERIKSKNMQTASEFAEALEKKVGRLIDEACQRAQDDKRKTVMDRDV